MKKEIMNLLKCEEGMFRLNNISYLKRWTKDGLGDSVDKLEVEFDSINNINFPMVDREIKSRDYDGIISECAEITEKFLDEVKRSLTSDLLAGYRNKTVILPTNI